MVQSEFRRNNHYVPEMYLKRWARDGLKVCAYSVLVPHENYPVWKSVFLSGTAVRQHLYTQFADGVELDDIERWFSREFEEPAGPAIEKVEGGLPLTPKDWEKLIRFVALQDVRTPARMLETLQQVEGWLPGLLQSTAENAVAELQAAYDEGRNLNIPTDVSAPLFPIAVSTSIEDGADTGTLGVETVVGRGMWLYTVQHVLTHTINALLQHRWTILRPPQGMSWVTSDNPVVRLNYYGPGKYDFKGGWGSKGSEIILPLSPQHLLYTRIGERPLPKGSQVNPAFAQLIQKMLAENAHRYVFAETEEASVPLVRQRYIDADAVRHEARGWEQFHDVQATAERELLEPLGQKSGSPAGEMLG